MSLGIIRGEIERVLERLKENDFDDEEYPIKKYQTAYDVSIDGEELHLIPGTQLTPVSEFVVKYGNLDFTYDAEPPGILPYVSGSFQIKGVNPEPIDVGLPILSNERDGKMAVRWLLEETKSSGSDLSQWGRLRASDVEEIRETAKPDKEAVIKKREGSSNLSPSIIYPETQDVVKSRREDYWWEPWCARRQEIMSSWRVLVPNTSVTLYPMLLSPENTVVADNFNIIILPDGETAVALATVLGTQQSQDFLRDISPWASGDTPRVRGKHVGATIHQNQEIIEEVLADKQSELSEIAENLEQVHEKMNEVLRGYVGESDDSQHRFRTRYTGVSDKNRTDDEIDNVKEFTENGVVLGTSGGDIEVEFHDEEYAGAFAIGAWLAVGFGDSVESLLDVPSARIEIDPVEQVLCKRSVGELRDEIAEKYY